MKHKLVKMCKKKHEHTFRHYKLKKIKNVYNLGIKFIFQVRLEVIALGLRKVTLRPARPELGTD